MKTCNAIIVTLLLIFCSADTTSHALPSPPLTHYKPITVPKQVHKPPPITAIASAYYKPVRGQRRYVTGSYSGDIYLNGTGVTYSGKKARIGHLAADLRYNPIGTKFHVFIDGKDFGLWTVEDKGGAIKGPRRFDFFMGENDAGRIAAESWGLGDNQTIVMHRVG